MSSMEARRCPDCDRDMNRIRLIDKAHDGGHTSLEYSAHDAVRSLWFGKYPVAGVVTAYMCDDCGRILLFGGNSDE